MGITINNNIEKDNVAEITVTTINEDEAYKLCVKADALRLANMFQESIPKYLRSIFNKRDNADAYYGLALSYKALKNYDKAIETLEKALSCVQDDFSI